MRSRVGQPRPGGIPLRPGALPPPRGGPSEMPGDSRTDCMFWTVRTFWTRSNSGPGVFWTRSIFWTGRTLWTGVQAHPEERSQRSLDQVHLHNLAAQQSGNHFGGGVLRELSCGRWTIHPPSLPRGIPLQPPSARTPTFNQLHGPFASPRLCVNWSLGPSVRPHCPLRHLPGTRLRRAPAPWKVALPARASSTRICS